ncbi:MAG: hypothetical protein ACOYN4_21150, partial [Bacteroidales bacterium]
NQVFCQGETTPITTFSTSNTAGTTTYTWTNNQISIGLSGSGSGNIPSFTATNTSSIPVIADVIVTPFFTNGGKTCAGPTKQFSITVNPAGQVNQPTSQVFCQGETTTVIPFNTINTVGTTTYTWTNNQTSIGLGSTGSGSITIFTASNTGTSPVVATILVTPYSTNGGTTCEGSTKQFDITVNPAGQVNQPANQTYCQGEVTPILPFSTNNTVGITTYTWSNSQILIGLVGSGSGSIPIFTATNTSISPVSGTIVVTPYFTNIGKTCEGDPMQFDITVNPVGQVNQPSSQEVCAGSTTSTVLFNTNNTGSFTNYTWTNSNTIIGLDFAGTGDILSFTASNSTSLPQVAIINVTPIFINGSVSCPGAAKNFSITVSPKGQVNPTANQEICNGDLTGLIAFTTINSNGITTYSWTNTNSTIGMDSGGSGDIPSFTAINTTSLPQIATISVTPTFINGSMSCTGAAIDFNLIVNPAGQVNQPANQLVCNGGTTAATAFTTNNSVGTTLYYWTNSNPSIGLADQGSGDIPSFNAINTTLVIQGALIKVTPVFTNGSASCLQTA